MKLKRVHVIVNPASGKDQPILHTLNSIFHPVGIDWDIYVPKAGATRGERGRLTLEKPWSGHCLR
jgi:diacylglycerol kinase (ATP)